MKIGCSLRLFCSSSGRPTCNRTQWLQPWDLLLLSSSYLGEGCVPTRRRSIPCTIPCTTMLTDAAAAAFIAACSGSSVCTLARCTCTGGNWVTYVPRLTTGRQLVSDRAGQCRSVGRVTVRGARQAGAAGVASVRAPHRFGGGLVVVEAGRRVHGKLPPARRGGAHRSLERLRFPGERLCV